MKWKCQTADDDSGATIAEGGAGVLLELWQTRHNFSNVGSECGRPTNESTIRGAEVNAPRHILQRRQRTSYSSSESKNVSKMNREELNRVFRDSLRVKCNELLKVPDLVHRAVVVKVRSLIADPSRRIKTENLCRGLKVINEVSRRNFISFS